MDRFPRYDMHNGSGEQIEVLTEINQDRGRAGKPVTPQFGMLLGSPKAARQIARLGVYCKKDTSLSDLTREAVTLAVAYAKNSDYEAIPHETHIRKLGVPEELITSLRERRICALPDALQPAVALALAMVDGNVTQPCVEEAKARLGERQALDVVITTAYYVMLATIGAALAPEPFVKRER